MTFLLKEAISELEECGYTCVIKSGSETYSDKRRGVAPLLSMLEAGVPCKGASAADKVVGAGAAYLYVLLEIKELYASVISERAKKIVTSHGIELYFGVEAPYIKNRAGDGTCPIEAAVADATDARDALGKIKARLKQLSEGK